MVIPALLHIPVACCLLACVDVDLFLCFLLFLPFFDLDLDFVCFILSFLAGAMLSPRFRFLVRLVYFACDMYLDSTRIYETGGGTRGGSDLQCAHRGCEREERLWTCRVCVGEGAATLM